MRTRRCAALIVVLAIAGAVAACEQDPAGNVKIAATAAPAPAAETVAVRPASDASPPGVHLRANLCPPPPETAGGPSSLIGLGPCAFEQHGPLDCSLTDDDLLMQAVRPMPGDALYMVYFSVEDFHKPGTFDNAQLVVGVQGAQGLYRWATDQAHVVVSPGEKSVTVGEMHLPPVPPMQEPDMIVSGTLVCGQVSDRRSAPPR